MESHLNLAHRSHRKAEFYSRCHRFVEAIFHYTKAIKYLEHSIQITSCDSIRSSLLVQSEHCHNQIEHLKRRLQSQNNKLITDHRESVPIRSQSNSFSSSSSSDPASNRIRKSHKNTMADHLPSGSKDSHVLKMIKRQYDLLEQLSLAIATEDRQPSSDTKLNKNQKILAEITNEIQSINERIETNIRSMIESMEKSRQEIIDLQTENQTLKKELNTLKNEQTNRASYPELPPLETPKLLY